MDDCEIIILNSPIYINSTDDGEEYLPPLGQGYIASQLIKDGIHVEIIDCINERMGIDEVVQLINESTVLNVALNIFSVNYEIIKSIVENVNRKVNWFFGGKAVKYLWKTMLDWQWNGNKVVYTIGECDTLYTDLLLNTCKEDPIYEKEMQKVYMVDKTSAYYPRKLDEYVLDRELFKDRAILNHYGKWEQCLIGSRECMYNCAFCGGSRYANVNTTVRTRSSESIIREINEIISLDHRIESIRILDDLFLRNRQNVLQAIKIFNYFPNVNWRGMAHVKSLLNAKDLFEKLRDSGCKELFVGIESGSSVIRERIHKDATVEEVIDVIKGLLEVGIDVKGYFVCGFPDETESQIMETVQLASKIKIIAQAVRGNFRATAFQFRPYHGTEIYDYLYKEGKIIDGYQNVKNTSSKMQYSFIVKNYSDVDDSLLKKSIDAIVKR